MAAVCFRSCRRDRSSFLNFRNLGICVLNPLPLCQKHLQHHSLYSLLLLPVKAWFDDREW